MNPTVCTHKNNPNFWIFGLFFFLYFFIMATCFPFLPIWLSDVIGLNKTGFSEAIWQVIITLAIIISTWYSANYFAALEARRDKRRYLLLAWVVMTILLNFIHLGGG